MKQSIEVNELTVPVLGFGTWELRGDEAYRSVRTALDVGYRHVDTAQGYENETEVGKALADSGVDRDEVFLTTKIKPWNAAADDVRSSTEDSLRRLDVDQVDLLLLHWPAEDTAPLEETLGAMSELQTKGWTRSIGVSNFPSQMLARACELAPVVTDQVEHHPYLAVDAITEVMHANGGFVTAYSPIARGRLLGDAVLAQIAAAHDVTVPQVALRWLLQRGYVTIPRSSNPDNIAANFDVFGFDLSDDEVARITGLARGERFVAPDWSPDWDER